MGNEEQEKQLREWYEKNRSHYLGRVESQQLLFDKTLILLSSGAVAGLVSVADKVGSVWWLKATIAMFLGAIVSSMLSLVFSVNLQNSFMEQFDRNFKEQEYGKSLASAWNSWVGITNIVTIVCAVLGTIGIAVLVWGYTPALSKGA
ncbi:hypothetical protein LF599_02600 [Pseudodesulfovibrio thermohalotolerans]|uniref:hypothetical protein n=1 Tax=Pseudodesulfovibrio thermohalotolerans TaxID=2880651 RepID=UPI002442F8CC|nr:hypothetical protein [Pseudodesulfovibrio thermohalotolerans]WFS63067.1 hypothetical protein LF599_02600 [Pseudodesulfovibrio thermohalotolerans]